MTRVFISYRRDDTRWQAQRIYDVMVRTVGRDNVFMDVDSIPPGENFRKVLEGWVGNCDVLLAVIGTGWIDARDSAGQRRLDNPGDFVRFEIGVALARAIPVVPIILDGAPVPDPALLPPEIKELSERQAQFVQFRTFDGDLARLTGKLGLSPAPEPAGAIVAGPEPVVAKPDRDLPIDAPIMNGAIDGRLEPGAGRTSWFKDHDLGPEMVLVPAGSVMMGSSPDTIAALKSDNRNEWYGCEGPKHPITIASPFAVSRHAITFAQWDAAGLQHLPRDQGWGRGDRPVVNASWLDACAYAEWLCDATGKPYRLLSEAEWEYVCRAGTSTTFWWGDAISTARANYNGSVAYGGSAKGENRGQTVLAGQFQSNPWGLFQVHGNVWEWCADNWHDNYQDAPRRPQLRRWISAGARPVISRHRGFGRRLTDAPGQALPWRA